MTIPDADESRAYADDEISLMALGTVLLRWRRTIIRLGLLGGLLGLAAGLLSRRVFVSTAAFIPQAPDGAASGFLLAASQFGVRIPATGNTWGPPIYVELAGGVRARAVPALGVEPRGVGSETRGGDHPLAQQIVAAIPDLAGGRCDSLSLGGAGRLPGKAGRQMVRPWGFGRPRSSLVLNLRIPG